MVSDHAIAQQVTIDSTNSYNTTYNLSGGNLLITNTGSITSVGSSAILVGTSPVGTFDNAGSISAFSLGMSFSNLSNVGTLVNSGRIYGGSAAMEVHGTIGTLSNTGTITGGVVGMYITSSSTLTSATNNAGATINGIYGFLNESVVSSLNNQGTANGTTYGIYNTSNGTIGTLTNSGTITGVNAAVSNSAQIGTLSSSGLIRASGTSNSAAAISNTSIGTISNLQVTGGTISGNKAISNAGLIGNISIQSGSIAGTATGIYNSGSGTITALLNNGTIVGTGYGIQNDGGSKISSLTNSGVISSAGYALSNSATGTLGPVTNSGLIAGTIANLSSRDLMINGGAGTVFGTLTGSSGSISTGAMGSIVNTGANLNFGSGNILLNDNINTGAYTVSNIASTLQINNRTTITGNYSQGANARLLVGVNDGATATGSASNTGYGYLYVQGNSTISPGATIGLTKTNSYAFANGQRYVALITTGATNYAAEKLNYSLPGFTVTGANVTDGSNTNLVLTLGTPAASGIPGSAPSAFPSTAVSNFATTPNAVSALSGLNTYAGANIGLLNVFNAAAALGSTAAANKAGAVLSPAATTTAVAQSSAAATTQVLGVVAAHVDGLRVAQVAGETGIATGESTSNWAVWGQSFGGSASQDMRDDVSGFRSSYSGFVLGADRMVSERWRAGALLNYASNSISGRDDNTGSSAHVNSYGLMGYGGYAADSWYVDVVAGAIRHKYDSTRQVAFDGFSGTTSGNFNGIQYATSLQAGMPVKFDHTTMTPLAGLGYSNMRQTGYTETGGNGAALSVNGSKNSSLKSELGAKLERSFSMSYGELVPAAQLTWRHEFRDHAPQSVASFAADTTGSTSFTSLGVSPLRDTGVMALSATLVRHSNLSIVARYTLEAGSGYFGQTGDIRLRYQF